MTQSALKPASPRNFAWRWLPCLELWIATLWVGSLWTVGYVAAPTLFAALPDRALAGAIAGALFRTQAWISLICAALLLVIYAWLPRLESATRKSYLLLIVAMMACTAVGYFGLQPFMATIRETAAASGAMSPEAKRQFFVLHGAASGIFLIQSLMGALLMVKQAATSAKTVGP